MTTKNILIAATMAALGGLVLGGTINNNDHLYGLVSTGWAFEWIRFGLFATLGALLVWSPPRSMQFRIFLAAASGLLAATAMGLTFNYAMNVIDLAIFLEVAAIFGLEALELQGAKQSQPKVRVSRQS